MAIYMKYGSIKGDATLKNPLEKGDATPKDSLEHSINIHHFKWDVDRAVVKQPAGRGTTREAKKPQLNPFEISKEADSASAELLIATCNGSKPELCKISFVRTGDETPYMEYTFYESLITKITTASEGERPVETITFDFTAVEMTLYSADSTNKKKGDFHHFPRFSLIDKK